MVVQLTRRSFVAGVAALGVAAVTVSASAQDVAKRGGLGLTGAEWKELWGKPDAEVSGKYWKFEYKRFGITIRLIYFEDDQHVIGFDVAPVAPLGADRMGGFTASIETFFPADAVQIDQYARPAGPGTVVVYNSPWLAERFLAIDDPVIDDWFPGGNPGDFIVIYQENSSGLVEGVVTGLGNNP